MCKNLVWKVTKRKYENWLRQKMNIKNCFHLCIHGLHTTDPNNVACVICVCSFIQNMLHCKVIGIHGYAVGFPAALLRNIILIPSYRMYIVHISLYPVIHSRTVFSSYWPSFIMNTCITHCNTILLLIIFFHFVLYAFLYYVHHFITSFWVKCEYSLQRRPIFLS